MTVVLKTASHRPMVYEQWTRPFTAAPRDLHAEGAREHPPADGSAEVTYMTAQVDAHDVAEKARFRSLTGRNLRIFLPPTARKNARTAGSNHPFIFRVIYVVHRG
jgi:hypothetical protein